MGPNGLPQDVTGAANVVVARIVALLVVDRLEHVQVDHGDDGRVAQAREALAVVGDQPLPGASVGQPRQHVGLGLVTGCRHVLRGEVSGAVGGQHHGQELTQQLQDRRRSGEGHVVGAGERVDPADGPEDRTVRLADDGARVRADVHGGVHPGGGVGRHRLGVRCDRRRGAGSHVDAEAVLPRVGCALGQAVPVVGVQVEVGLAVVLDPGHRPEGHREGLTQVVQHVVRCVVEGHRRGQQGNARHGRRPFRLPCVSWPDMRSIGT